MSYPGVDPTEVSVEEESSVGLPNTPNLELVKAAEKAAAQAMKDMFAVNQNAWAPKLIVKFKLELPSGQTVLFKHLDILDLLDDDLVEEMDSFTKKLFPASIDPSGNPVEEAQEQAETGIWSVLRSPEKRERFLEMTGRLMAAASVKPRILFDGVYIHEHEETGKKTVKFGYQVEGIDKQVELLGKPVPQLGENEVYAGYIGIVDRLVIFQELNKPLGMIEPFREESPEVLQNMARSEGTGDTAE